ncbi:hypothetical protein TIFTF001_017205 [Ficus carica]|uniref:Uncharacterized protein n=1 Tax=Ficus carica TaxID=3494 RepID=A0AA88D816_FICCA|nr:hypothetical protein TIFTF001_017205 [Ficus carica]
MAAAREASCDFRRYDDVGGGGNLELGPKSIQAVAPKLSSSPPLRRRLRQKHGRRGDHLATATSGNRRVDDRCRATTSPSLTPMEIATAIDFAPDSSLEK